MVGRAGISALLAAGNPALAQGTSCSGQEFHQLRLDDFLALGDLQGAARAGLVGELLQGVDVVEIDLLDLADGVLDVTWDGDVDEEIGTTYKLGANKLGANKRSR